VIPLALNQIISVLRFHRIHGRIFEFHGPRKREEDRREKTKVFSLPSMAGDKEERPSVYAMRRT
jgi:hypothetical protein